MGKRIIPLLLTPAVPDPDSESGNRLARVRAESQHIDLSHCVDAEGCLDPDADPETSERLKLGLRAAGAITGVGLDPAAFGIDRTRRSAPFPGLVSFGDDDADAALFYGRSREIADTLEELRKMRAERDLRP